MLVRDLALLSPDEKPNHTLPGRGPALNRSPSVLLIRARPALRDVLGRELLFSGAFIRFLFAPRAASVSRE